MNSSLEELKRSAAHLSVPERAELAHYLLQSLEPNEEGVSEAWHTELKRRMAEIRSGQVVGKPVEEVLARLREVPVKPVMMHPDAESELEEAAAYYERQRAGLGQEFRLEFEAALGRLLENPLTYPVEVEEVRACSLKRFPYTIYYAELEGQIWLAAVAHQHRRPGYWSRRQPG